MPNKLRNRVELRTYEEDMSDFSGGDSVTKKSTRNNILDQQNFLFLVFEQNKIFYFFTGTALQTLNAYSQNQNIWQILPEKNIVIMAAYVCNVWFGQVTVFGLAN